MKDFLNNLIIVGTPKADPMSFTWSENSIGAVVTCYSAIASNDFSSHATCVASLAYGMNPSSGCQYPLINPFESTTDFEKDHIYSDYPNPEIYGQYRSVLSSVAYSSQTFPDNNLLNDEWAVSYTAFNLEENGYTFCVLVHPNEINLKNFCEIHGWNYRIIDS